VGAWRMMMGRWEGGRGALGLWIFGTCFLGLGSGLKSLHACIQLHLFVSDKSQASNSGVIMWLKISGAQKVSYRGFWIVNCGLL